MKLVRVWLNPGDWRLKEINKEALTVEGTTIDIEGYEPVGKEEVAIDVGGRVIVKPMDIYYILGQMYVRLEEIL